jgi:hypothetical protein
MESSGCLRDERLLTSPGALEKTSWPYAPQHSIKEIAMSVRMTTSLITSAMLVTGMTALAQSPSTDNAPAMTCQQSMDKAKPMVAQVTDATKMAEAQKHMSMAQSAWDAGKTPGCESEMKQVMQILK